MLIEGVGPDAAECVNERGGRQSTSPFRMDLLPARATLAVAQVLKHGAAKYGVDNWRRLSVAEVLNHALVHCYAWLAGDNQDDHLEHAACRLLMALELAIAERQRNPSGEPGEDGDGLGLDGVGL